MKKFLIWLLVPVMVLSMIPMQAFALDTETESAGSEITAVSENATDVEDVSAEAEAPAGEETAAERVCEEGCILESEEDHLENGGECLVWNACTLSNGCELADGHEGECTTASVFASATVTVEYNYTSGGGRPGQTSTGTATLKNAYIVVGSDDESRNDTVYYVNSNGVIVDGSGNEVLFDAGTYTIWYGTEGATANRAFYKGTVTVDGSDTNFTATLLATSTSTAASASAITEDQWNYATCVYYNTTTCDHIHIRVSGSYTIDVGGTTYSATVSNPSITVYVNDVYNTGKTWTGTTSYEWTYKTDIALSNEIEVHLIMDLTYTDANGVTHTIEDVDIVYNNMTDRDRWIEFIAICDGFQGFDFTVSIQDIEEVINYYTVIYQWKVYNLDGTVSDTLPANLGSHGLPATETGIPENTEYVYNTGYAQGTSYYDYENGLLYTFYGWDTWSHSSVFGVDPNVEGYHKLDDGDTDASNNETITITADTWINGYWKVSTLDTAEAYLLLHKDVIVSSGDEEYVTNYLSSIGKLYISADTGADMDGDESNQVDIDYPAAVAEGGHRLDVFQYETPFVFTEYQADVPGYTRTVTVTVTENSNLTLNAQNGDSATIAISPEYDPALAPYNLGTVTYTNTYTKNVGEAVSVYPSLYLLKSATDGGFQDGVVFTLYSDENCTQVIGTYTTADGGQIDISFENLEAGTYYLKETTAAYGYVADPYVYTITLTAGTPVEELRNNEYVSVTYYSLSISKPEESTAVVHGSNSLHVYNEPVVGSLTLSKTFLFKDADGSERSNAIAEVANDYFTFHVHGPITRNADGAITNLGAEREIKLYGKDIADGKLTYTLSNLSVGEYLVHETFASIHGYMWEGASWTGGDTVTLTFDGIEYLYRLITVGADNSEISLSLVNNYKEIEASDFYIYKTDGSTHLGGAAFQLYTDAACSTKASGDFTTYAVTGMDGYAYFSGFTVPEGQETATYYLKEVSSPAGYYLSNQVYKVEIKAVTDASGKTSYDAKITDADGNEISIWDRAQDVLTVTNAPVLGELTITKTLIGAPANVTSVTISVSGPNGYHNTVVLNSENSWSVTLTNLRLGTYTIVEQDASIPGYDLAVEYNVGETTSAYNAVVTLSESNPGYTVTTDVISGAVAVTNTYTKREAFYEVPTTLTVKKVGEDGATPLAGAVFRMDKLSVDGNTVVATKTFTSNAEGIVVFDLLYGWVVEGDDVNGTYILTEIQAPDGYQAISTAWTITVNDEDGELRIVLNLDNNVFENFWDWVVGSVAGENSEKWSYADGVLTVQNLKKTGSITVTKAVADSAEYYSHAEYSFTLDCSDNDFDQTFTLKAGDSKTIENIPWGTTYTLTENTTGAAYTSSISDSGNGLVWADSTAINVTNTYAYTTHNEGLNLVKVDADDNAMVIAGAGFTLYADDALTTKVGEEVFSDSSGKLTLPIAAAGTYYLVESTTPAGYHPNSAVYVVTAEQKYVVKNAGTADAVTEIQMHISIAGLSGATTNQIDYIYSIENTAIKTVVVTVEKVWDDGGYHARPDSVQVTLYRDNEAFESVTLNEDNDWRYTWDNLTDEYSWSVDEENIPSGYSKTVENEGNHWTLTNTRAPKEIEISVTKTWQHNGGKDLPESVQITLYSDGEEYDTVTLNEDNGWTHTWTGLSDVYVWSVDEINVPAGYTKEIITEDGLTLTVINTRTINPVEVSVTKVWVASEGVTHPESVEAVLYRDGEVFETVLLDEGNDWSYNWTGLTDEYTWSVDEKSVPAGYTKNVTVNGNDFTITNTKDFRYIDVKVTKIWYGANVVHPTSVSVTVYRDGVAYDTVTLSASNNWTYTWENLTDEFEWTVDEPSVPSGYNKTVRRNGYSFTVTNVHEDNPKTGDFASPMSMGIVATVGMIGFGVSATMLLKSRKKEEDDL